MANAIWTGGAQSVAQVSTVTLGGTWADTETATITVGGTKSVTYTCGAAETPSTVAAALQALAAASTFPEFTEITWTVSTTVVTATSTAGVPVTISVSEASASGTITLATPTAAAGPNFWSGANNWSTGAVPAAGDNVFISGDAKIYYGLPDGSVSLATFEMQSGQLGLPDVRSNGYAEYRTKVAAITCPVAKLGVGPNRGPSLARLSVQGESTILVNGSQYGASLSGGANPDAVPIELQTNSIGTSLNVLSGDVGLGIAPGQSCSCSVVRCAEGGTVRIGSAVTLTSIINTGRTSTQSNVNAVVVDNGTVELLGSAVVSSLIVRGGRVVHNSSGTITAAVVGPGVLDASQDIRARTITGLTLNKGGSLNDPYKLVAITNGVVLGSDADRLLAS